MNKQFNTKVRNTLPFLIIQDDIVVYASQVFCRSYNIDNHVFGSSRIPIHEVFEGNDIQISSCFHDQDVLKQQFKKPVKLKGGQVVYVSTREIKWNNSPAYQIFFSK